MPLTSHLSIAQATPVGLDHASWSCYYNTPDPQQGPWSHQDLTSHVTQTYSNNMPLFGKYMTRP